MKNIDVKKLGTAEVIVDIVAKGNFEIRPAYAMNPSQIAVHNTGNAGKGAGAKAHNTYIHNMAGKTPAQTGYASWHFSVDDKFIYQHLPLDESAWHTGDGSKETSGNRTAIGIEICENPETDTHQAEENAIALIVYLMKQFNISADKVKSHQEFSGKYCPRVILKRDGGFDKFRKRVILAKAETQVKPVPVPAGHYKVVAGDTLWGISKKHNITVDELKAINGLKDNVIGIGDIIKVEKPAPKPEPKPEPKPAPKPVTPPPAPKEEARPTLKRGDTGKYVTELQTMLSKNGFFIVIDNVFGEGTFNDVQDFQKKNGLTADGIVGAKTWEKLIAVTKPEAPKTPEYRVGEVISNVWLHNSGSGEFAVETRIRILEAGEKYKVYGEVNGMYRVGQNAYVSKKYIKIV